MRRQTPQTTLRVDDLGCRFGARPSFCQECMWPAALRPFIAFKALKFWDILVGSFTLSSGWFGWITRIRLLQYYEIGMKLPWKVLHSSPCQSGGRRLIAYLKSRELLMYFPWYHVNWLHPKVTCCDDGSCTAKTWSFVLKTGAWVSCGPCFVSRKKHISNNLSSMLVGVMTKIQVPLEWYPGGWMQG